MPSWNHSLAQSYLVGALLNRYEGQYLILTELTLALADGPLVPDVSIYPKVANDWRHDIVKQVEPPLMVIEILSPRQTADDLIEKADAYFEAGVKSCWIVQPSFEAIAVLLPDAKPQFFTTGEVVDPGTGITVAVEEIFR